MYRHVSVSGSNPGGKPGKCGFYPECPPGTNLLNVMGDPALDQLTPEESSAEIRDRWRGLPAPDWRLEARIHNAMLARRHLEETTRRVQDTDSVRMTAASPGSDKPPIGAVAAVPSRKTQDPTLPGYFALFRVITAGRKQATPRKRTHRRGA